MRIAVMQPYLFPYIGYFQLVHAVDKFVVFDDVNYINKGWINRNRILVNGAAHLFTIPLIAASQNKLIDEIDVDPADKWRIKFLRTIEMSYSKAPYFKDVFLLVQGIINNPAVNLSQYVCFSIANIASYLGVNTEIVPSSRKYYNQELKAQERIIDICLRENAVEYINPIGGLELYSKEKFDEKGLKLFFIKTREITYPQLGKDFVPWLSIIDVLMFCGAGQTADLLKRYELV